MIVSQMGPMGAMGLSSFTTNIHAAIGPSAAGRAALVQDLTTTSAINHSLPPSKAGVPSAVSTAKPVATPVKAATASSSNETVYIAAGVAALLVVSVVALKLTKKKR